MSGARRAGHAIPVLISATALAVAVTALPGGAVASARASGAAGAAVDAAAAPADARLDPGETLGPGERLVSPSGQFALVVPVEFSDMHVVTEGPDRWSSRESDTLFAPVGEDIRVEFLGLVMHAGGGLVEYTAISYRGVPIGTHVPWLRHGEPGSSLVMQDDGNLVLYAPDGRALWSSDYDRWSSTVPRHFAWWQRPLTSPDGRYALVSQTDGNAVVYGPDGPVFSTGTHGHPGGRLAFTRWGELQVVVNGGLTTLWQTHIVREGGATLRLQDDGNLVVYSPWGEPYWSSRTSGGTFSTPRELEPV